MKHGLVFTLFFILLGTLNAQRNSLREVVATVRPVYSESTVTFLNSFADHLLDQGYDSLSVQLKRYAKGNSFGSGFAITNVVDSQTYILTNRHVVAQAQFVDVEFSLEDQSVKTFTNCKIVSVDFDDDLALISLPLGVRLDRTLVFATQKAEDGEDVFTAGYPGLADKASWQIGKGIVSNSSVHLEELIPSKNSIIQHTAQVDPGSSGGPLLRKNPDAPRGYEVVGMNTWKVSERENANFSIQSSIIQSFVDASLKGENKKSKESLQKQVTDFIGFAKDGYKTILPFISYEYISMLSIDKFFELYGNANPEIKKVVKYQFNEESPIEAVRVIIASVIADNMSKSSWAFENIEGFSNEGLVTVNLRKGDQLVKTSWITDQGRWRISQMESVSFAENKKFRIDNSYGYLYSVTLVKNFDLNHKGLSYWELLETTTFQSYYTLGLGVNGGTLFALPGDFNEDGNNTTTFMGVEVHAGVQLPLKYGPLYVVPYFRTIGGLDFPVAEYDGGGISYGYRLGVELTTHLKGDHYLMASLGYRNKSFISFDTPWDPISSLSLSLGYSF
ncbi:MAG TPA: serine protease [Bacteroidales bacterium]|nr:serine protease [Bacteroidales bacterium]